MENIPQLHATTVIGIVRNGKAALGSDGQVTFGNTVMKGNAKKVRKLYNGNVIAGFAGSTSDALTLFEKFEAKLEEFRGNMPRAAVELGKEWRLDKYLRRLEAMLAVVSKDNAYLSFRKWRCHRTGAWNYRHRFRRTLCVCCSEGIYEK